MRQLVLKPRPISPHERFMPTYEPALRPAERYSVRKEKRIRPGFTPQEDVSRFRGSRQQQMDKTAMPKGHILGWVAPTAAQPAKAQSKSAKKNAKRKEKRDEKKAEETAAKIKDSWEDDDEDEAPPASGSAPDKAKVQGSAETKDGQDAKAGSNPDVLAEKMEKLEVR